MKSKGSAWDVVFSDLSLNTALTALTLNQRMISWEARLTREYFAFPGKK